MFTRTWSRGRWRTVSILAGVGGGWVAVAIAVAASGDETVRPGLFVAFGLSTIAGFAAGIVAYIAIGKARAATQQMNQLAALVRVRPLVGSLPVPLGGVSADPLLIDRIVSELIERQPTLVFECGSGSSTIYISACLRAMGHGKVISVEHDAIYASRTRAMADRHGLGAHVDVVLAPLENRTSEGAETTMYWYGPQYEQFLTGPIDVVVIDGPPAKSAPWARFPALPLLRRHLADDCVLILDDGDRLHERQTATRWARQLGTKATYIPSGHGAWIIETRTGASSDSR